MSVARGVPGADGPQPGEKIVLPRAPKAMWRTIDLHWADGQAFRWRALAMLHLHVHCGWTVTMVARAFAVHKGQASRQIHACRRQLADVFEVEHGPETEELPAEEDDGEDLPSADRAAA